MIQFIIYARAKTVEKAQITIMRAFFARISDVNKKIIAFN
jgi:hypothetical protein